MIGKLALIGAALLALALPALASGAGSMTPVTLTIANGTSQPLRCTAVLAHFMSEDLGSIEAGAEREVALRRELESGLLALGPREGRDVPLENLQCGLAGDWAGSVRDLPLTALRDDPAQSYRASCTLSDRRVICPIEAAR